MKFCGRLNELIKNNAVAYFIAAYFLTGLIMGITSYAAGFFSGKEIVFSPLTGLPFTMIAWPQYILANIINGFFGIADIAAIITLFFLITLFLNAEKKMN